LDSDLVANPGHVILNHQLNFSADCSSATTEKQIELTVKARQKPSSCLIDSWNEMLPMKKRSSQMSNSSLKHFFAGYHLLYEIKS